MAQRAGEGAVTGTWVRYGFSAGCCGRREERGLEWFLVKKVVVV